MQDLSHKQRFASCRFGLSLGMPLHVWFCVARKALGSSRLEFEIEANVLGVQGLGGCTVDDISPALPCGPQTMGSMVKSLIWVMQDIYHQPYAASRLLGINPKPLTVP